MQTIVRRGVCAVLVGLMLGLNPGVAAADDKVKMGKKFWGVMLMGTGAAFTALAWEWDSHCPAGYTTHTVQGYQTQCVYVDRFGSDVRPESTSATFRYPAMLWSGVAMAGTGTVLMLLPSKAKRITKGVTVDVTPHGWRAAKTFELK